MKSRHLSRGARSAAILLFLSSAGCRQIFGLEEPTESDACLSASKPVVSLTDIGPPGKTLGCENDYVIEKDVSVLDGAALTIEPGTTVRAKADARLIVEPGGKLLADGTAERPIVFTRDGDSVWGGIELRGKASGDGAVCTGDYPFTFAANPDASDNSGVLRYVRIEHAGSQNTACTGALILLGVGDGTVLDQLDLPFSDSDGVSIAGGTPSLSHVVVTDSADDGIDLENAAKAKIQFYVYRGKAMVGCPNQDHCPNAIDADGATIEAYNATLCGHQTKDTEKNVAILSIAGSSITLERSIVLDHSAALDVETDTKEATPVLLETSVFADGLAVGLAEGNPGDDNGFDEGQFAAPAHQNSSLSTAPIQCFGEVNLTPTAEFGNVGSPPLGSFLDAKYTGALHADDPWMAWIVVPP